MNKIDCISGLFLLVLGIGVFLVSFTYPIGTLRTPGGGFFPLLASILLMALAGVITIQAFMKKQGETTQPFFSGKEALKRVLIGLVTLLGFRYLLPFIGFGFSAFLFVLFLAKYLGHYNWKVSLLFSALTAVAAYYLFQVWLKVPMPTPFLRF